ncbi:MAG: pyridoxal phosphate-dependent aminotransferase, partial [Flavobacteriaceae bacterium]|nr:pyridoxal phosphate-dependent aminotransferase [Flavobacteriaceae bacterium]
QILDLDIVYFSKYFWGSYQKLCTIRRLESDTFENLNSFVESIRNLRKSETTVSKRIAVLLCDPNNPVGNKLDDAELLEQIKSLSDLGVIVIFDSPYRRLFYDASDTLYQKLLPLKNLIITESFSKTMGLSGQRIGFIHSTDKAFNDELNVRLLYAFNGVNAFAQELVLKLLTTPEGKKAVSNFKKKTVEDVTKNIQYLQDKKMLYQQLYENTKPVGIFTVVNLSEEKLLEHKIGSVSMGYFTNDKTTEIKATARICVSVPHEKFKLFFDNISN